MNILYLLLFLFCSPLFIVYFIFCYTIPAIKIGEIKRGKGLEIYIYKDSIHSDFIFDSSLIQDLFPSKNKYTKVGWGDRKIFLETPRWSKLKMKNLLFAFFGLNSTTLRVDYLEELPFCKIIEIDENQLQIIKNYIKESNNGKIIEKKEDYYPYGDYYESDLNYNCITNCNNWLNTALRKAKISNRVWCPITYWV